ncbi:MAG: endonuclease/exonuclease/phosphatase family protein [Sphaerochaetaceae bacterium]
MQRISLVSLNLWNTEHLEQRKECLVSFLKTYRSDIFCFQEIRKELRDLFDTTLEGYQRIEDPHMGWTRESNIYFNRSLLTLLDYGRVDLAMPETERGVFWVRLKTLEGKNLVVATMHLTHQLNADENRTGIPYRPAEARKAAKALLEIVKNDGAIVCGDFNDPVQPVRILHEDAQFEDVFSLLKIPSPVTFPCVFLSDEDNTVEAIDKIMVKNGVRPLIASSPHYHIPSQVLSDHYPVMTIVEY